MERVQEKKLDKWMIIAIIFMVLTIACGVAAVLAYINMPDKEQIAADAKTEAETAYNEKVSELKSYYESKIKTIEAEKNKALKEATGRQMGYIKYNLYRQRYNRQRLHLSTDCWQKSQNFR